MPLTPFNVAGILTQQLVVTGNIGVSVPQLALGVANGLCLWTSGTLLVATVDTGTLGAGVGAFPCVIPPPLLFAGLTLGFASAGLVGISVPSLLAGLTSGLALAFPTGVITTVHPAVSTGVATVTFPGPSSVPSMLTGFASAGMVGSNNAQLATGIGLGLDFSFASFTIPIPIVGPTTPSAGGGVGYGKIV